MPLFFESSDESYKTENRRLDGELTVGTGVESSQREATECQLSQLVPFTVKLLQAT